MDTPCIRLLTFTRLYPDSLRPDHGVFVENRLRHLVATRRVQSTVVVPVPWFPYQHVVPSKYSLFSQIPHKDKRHGINVLYPRYLSLPMIGNMSASVAMALSARSTVNKLVKNGYDFDLIDGHYFYPDGIAAAMLGRYLGKPLVITARGTDINLMARYAFPRKLILWAAERALRIVSVCQALKDELIAMGIPEHKIVVLRNGVDLKTFQPVEREVERRRLDLNGFTLLSVGHLIKLKGHDLAIKALTSLEDVKLLIVGEGPEKKTLKRLADSLKVAKRVRFIGTVPHSELRRYYGAADALVLASSREGWANVLLEAMACGTPVVASKVGGTPEVVGSPEAGTLLERRTADALVRAVQALRACYPDRDATRRYAEKFSWNDTTVAQISLFSDAINESRR